ncbi:hypothetical protein NDU88_009507 [Pleurodeles waltl]|uniref:Uncharacterized protein n=1 Tax=Pleurodeles waltl TaxID=8319 RepID=A0AAV7RZ78_PLEWA|nr:hypothetical protein NDU88_009507 [Pleurodeles waltl]
MEWGLLCVLATTDASEKGSYWTWGPLVALNQSGIGGSEDNVGRASETVDSPSAVVAPRPSLCVKAGAGLDPLQPFTRVLVTSRLGTWLGLRGHEPYEPNEHYRECLVLVILLRGSMLYAK